MDTESVKVDISRKYPISKIASEPRTASRPGADAHGLKQTVVEVASVMPSPLDSYSVFFKSLNKRTTVEHIYEAFSQFGKLLLIRLPFNLNKRCNVGYGFVVLQSADVASQLLNRVRTIRINGKMIHLLSFSKRSELEPCSRSAEEADECSTGQLFSIKPPITPTITSNVRSQLQPLENNLQPPRSDSRFRFSQREAEEEVREMHHLKPTQHSYFQYYSRQDLRGCISKRLCLDHSAMNVRFSLKMVLSN
jgi:RNA recognition motif-containing protein